MSWWCCVLSCNMCSLILVCVRVGVASNSVGGASALLTVVTSDMLLRILQVNNSSTIGLQLFWFLFRHLSPKLVLFSLRSTIIINSCVDIININARYDPSHLTDADRVWCISPWRCCCSVCVVCRWSTVVESVSSCSIGLLQLYWPVLRNPSLCSVEYNACVLACVQC